MTEFLVRHFVKDHEETEKVSVRTAYGVLASMVGIFCNVFLFVVKWLIGFFLQSISVMADAFNNLSDAGGSVIGLVGVKMAEKPADKDHLRPWEDRVHSGPGGVLSGAGSGIYLLQRRCGQDPGAGGHAVPAGVGGHPDAVCGSEAVAGLLQPEAGETDRLQGDVGHCHGRHRRRDYHGSHHRFRAVLADHRMEHRRVRGAWCFPGHYVGRYRDRQRYPGASDRETGVPGGI